MMFLSWRNSGWEAGKGVVVLRMGIVIEATMCWRLNLAKTRTLLYLEYALQSVGVGLY